MSSAAMSAATTSNRSGPIIELDGVVKAYRLNRPLGAMLSFQPPPMLQAVSEVSLAIETEFINQDQQTDVARVRRLQTQPGQ